MIQGGQRLFTPAYKQQETMVETAVDTSLDLF